MKGERIDKLQERGWIVGTVEQFLGLSDEESALIEIKLMLSRDPVSRLDTELWSISFIPLPPCYI